MIDGREQVSGLSSYNRIKRTVWDTMTDEEREAFVNQINGLWARDLSDAVELELE
jgi:hypothetical protein